MAYGIRIIIDFIYGNEHHQRSWAAAPVSFKGRKGAEDCVLLHALLGMFIAWMTATGYATNQIKEQMISWGFGALAVVRFWCGFAARAKMQHWRQSCWRRHLWCSAWWHYLLAKKD